MTNYEIVDYRLISDTLSLQELEAVWHLSSLGPDRSWHEDYAEVE